MWPDASSSEGDDKIPRSWGDTRSCGLETSRDRSSVHGHVRIAPLPWDTTLPPRTPDIRRLRGSGLSLESAPSVTDARVNGEVADAHRCSGMFHVKHGLEIRSARVQQFIDSLRITPRSAIRWVPQSPWWSAWMRSCPRPGFPVRAAWLLRLPGRPDPRLCPLGHPDACFCHPAISGTSGTSATAFALRQPTGITPATVSFRRGRTGP